MNVYEQKRRALGHHCPGIGGSSKTSSSTEVADMRVVGGEGSINVSNKGGSTSLSVIATDQGAVAGGLALGSKAVDTVAKTAADTVASSSAMFENALGEVAKAYQSGNAGEQTQLKYAGFIVVGLAVVAFVGSQMKR